MYVMTEYRSSLGGKTKIYNPQLRITEYHVKNEEDSAK